MIHIKRVYEASEEKDGFRILIDRLWPRGIKKDEANIHKWAKEVAPSSDLRKWFHHDPENWQAFKKKYLAELNHNDSLPNLLEDIKVNKTVTLLYAARDKEHNQALVLRDFLKSRLK